MAPLLVLMLLGGIEASWLLVQMVDVRGAAREAGRLASVDAGDSATIASLVCAGMDEDSNTTITLSGAASSLGDDIEATVARTPTLLTNLLSWAFPPTITLSSMSTFSLESAPPTWTDGSTAC